MPALATDTLLVLKGITIFTSLSFLYFGASCIVSQHMKREFIRYGIPKYRTLTGILQLAGGLALLVGTFISQTLTFAAALGLFLLMIMGYAIRLRINDTFIETLSALFYALLSFLICYKYYTLLGI